MRTLLALVAFVLVLAAAVWFKTTPADLPPTEMAHDSSIGIMTLGVVSNEATAESNSQPNAVAAVSESTENPTGQNPEQPSADVIVHEPVTPPVIERPEPEAVTVAGPINYVVKSGDSMYRIIMRCYGTYSEDLLQHVSDANNLRDPSAIGIGDKIVLPLIDGVNAPKIR